MKPATLFPNDNLRESESIWPDAARPRPKPYHNRTTTSRDAADSVRRSVNSQCAKVWQFINSQGEHGATDKEIQSALNMNGDSQRPRRVWLRDHGFIRAKGEASQIVIRDRSTVWVVARPLPINAVRTDGGER